MLTDLTSSVTPILLKFHRTLLANDYLAQRMNDYNPQKKATSSDAVKHGKIVWQESDETTHFSIVDAQGNAVAITTTLNGSYGSKLFVPAIGCL